MQKYQKLKTSIMFFIVNYRMRLLINGNLFRAIIDMTITLKVAIITFRIIYIGSYRPITISINSIFSISTISNNNRGLQ